MHLVISGLHQRTAPVALRERLAFSPDELCGALHALGQYVDEGFILSTCNRVEVYGLARDRATSETALQRFLADWHFVPIEQVQPHLYTHHGDAVTRHLFRLAAGLDSMVLGEDQILAQLKTALAAAHGAGSLGAVFYRLLHGALAAGKTVRSHTGIGQHHLSVVSLAIDLARQKLGDLAERRVLVLGAGQMAELALKYLQTSQARTVTVLNRSLERAEALAARFEVAARPFEHLPQALRASDLVISCTAAPHTVIDAPLLTGMLAGRERPLLLLDLAVPRDIDPAIRQLPGAELVDIDDLQALAAANRAARGAEAARAETLVAEEVARFSEWLAAQQVVPTIRALRERAETIRTAEIQRTLAKCPGLDEHERQAIEALTSAIVNKMLHHPIASLKHAGGDSQVSQLVHELFQLTTIGN